MPGWLLDLLMIATVVALLRLRPLFVLGLLVVLTLLVPASLAVPHTGGPYITAQHVLVAAAAVRVLALGREGVLRRGALRVTPVHLALGGLVAVSFLVGVLFAATSGSVGLAGFRLLDLFDQLLFFVVCLALVRHLADLRLVARVLAVAVLLSAFVAVVEHFTGSSFGHFLFSRLPAQSATDAATALQPRDGELRVRAGTEFSLQFAWVVVMLMPALAVAALQLARRPPWLRPLAVTAGLALTVLALYWSYTRSALAGLGLVFGALLVLARERRVTALVLGALAVAGLAYLADPSLGSHYNAQADEGSITIRFQRLGPILGSVAHHPFRGLGLGGLLTSGFPTADNAYLLEYAELGALGLTALVVVLLVAVAQSSRALLAADPDVRMVGAAAAVGVGAFVASTVFYDAVTLLQGSRLLWLLVAVATVAGEQAGLRSLLPRPSGRLVLATGLAGLVAGFAALAFAPMHVTVDALFTTLPTQRDAAAYDPVTAGNRLVATACGVALRADDVPAGSSIDCRNTFAAAGVGVLRVQGRSEAAVTAALLQVGAAVRDRAGVINYQPYVIGTFQHGRDSVWRTAPAWLPLGALALLALVPWRPARTRDSRTSSVSGPGDDLERRRQLQLAGSVPGR